MLDAGYWILDKKKREFTTISSISPRRRLSTSQRPETSIQDQLILAMVFVSTT
jgi:hypothetical protein